MTHMNSIVCDHCEAEKVGKACEHLLAKKVGGEYYPSQEHLRNFTGRGIEFILICPQCGERPDHGEPFWRTVCDSCVQDISCGKRLGDFGNPQVLTRQSGLKLVHQAVVLPTCNFRVIAAKPLAPFDAAAWIILTDTHELIEFNACKPSLHLATTISALGLSSDQPITVSVSRNGQFVAVTHTYGRDGVVFDRIKKRVAMRLLRGEYYPEHCKFSAVFFELENRQLLIHATDWNRLDISDPENGSLLTQRTPTSYLQGEVRPPHYLDYFHCGLAISPNSEWVADNGWVWHPVGIVVAWNLRRWLKENVWEAEDGESKKSLCSRSYSWDGPMCWIDNRTVAVWGLGEDDLLLIPGVRLFDVESGVEKFSFAGPIASPSTLPMNVRGKEQTVSHQLGTLAFDRWLFSWQPKGPFSVWDVNDGARLLIESDFAPLSYHPGTKTFLSQLVDGTFRLSTIHENL